MRYRSQELAEVGALIDALINALVACGQRHKYDPETLRRIHHDIHGINPPVRLKSNKPTTYGRLFGFGVQTHHYVDRTKDPKSESLLNPITAEHIENIQQTLSKLGIISNNFKATKDPSSWRSFLAIALQAAKNQSNLESRGKFTNSAGVILEPIDLGIPVTVARLTKDFLTHYLTSEFGQAPFGGRDDELAQLDDWLWNGDLPPRLLITSPAGWGKSALIVQWLASLQRRKDPVQALHIVFVPISMRCSTVKPSTFFQALASGLGGITQRATSTVDQDLEVASKDAVRQQLEYIGSAGRYVLIVLDGLDEALHGDFDAGVFSSLPSRGVRLLLSARQQVDDIDSQTWLKRLGWDEHVPAKAIELGRLREDQIAGVLHNLGAPAGALPQDHQLVSRLYELTEGDPILVRYYAEDLWGLAKTSAARITVDDLPKLRPGFDAYFRYWLKLQEDHWRAENVDWAQIDRVLSILSYAYGPLEREDLRGLIKVTHRWDDTVARHRLLEPVRRFVIGTGQPGNGYILCHSKIGEYLRDDWYPEDSDKIRAGFKTWCQTQLRALNSSPSPAHAPPYVLQFLRAHFNDAGASPAEWMELVENGWRLAWESLDGGPRGFAAEVQAAWDVVRQHDLAGSIAFEWRCALVLSSIQSFGNGMPWLLLVIAVEKGVLPSRQAAYFAATIRLDEHSIMALVGLALLTASNLVECCDCVSAALRRAMRISNRSERRRIIEKALDLAAPLYSLRNKVFLGTIKSYYEFTDNTLESLNQISPELTTAIRKMIRDLASSLPASDRFLILYYYLVLTAPPACPADLIQEAHRVALDIDVPDSRAKALMSTVGHLPKKQRAACLQEAIKVAHSTSKPLVRIDLLTSVTYHLPSKSSTLCAEALRTARTLRPKQHRVKALMKICDRLPVAHRLKIIAEAFAIARSVKDRTERSTGLRDLLFHLGFSRVIRRPVVKQITAEALHVAKKIKRQEIRALHLGWLAPYLSSRQRVEALEAVTEIEYPDSRAIALHLLAEHMPRATLEPAIQQTAAEVKQRDDRLDSLVYLAPYLPREQLNDVLGIALKDKSPAYLSSLAPVLSLEQLRRVIVAVSNIGDEDVRIPVLQELASIVSGEERAAILEELEAELSVLAPGPLFARRELLKAFVPRKRESTAILSCEQVDAELTNMQSMSLRGQAMALQHIVPLIPEDRRIPVVIAIMTTIDKMLKAIDEGDGMDRITGPMDMNMLVDALATAADASQRGEAVNKILYAVSRCARRYCVSCLGSAAYVSAQVGGARAIVQMAKSIREIARWYP